MNSVNSDINFRQELGTLVWYLKRGQWEAAVGRIERLLHLPLGLNPLFLQELQLLVDTLKLRDLERAASQLERCVGAGWNAFGLSLKLHLLKAAKSLRVGDMDRLIYHLGTIHRCLARQGGPYLAMNGTQ